MRAEEITQEYVDQRMKEIEDEARLRADSENQALWHQARRIARIKYYFWRHGRNTPDPQVTYGEIPEPVIEPEPEPEPVVYHPREPVSRPVEHSVHSGITGVGVKVVIMIAGMFTTIYIVQAVLNNIAAQIPNTPATVDTAFFQQTEMLTTMWTNSVQLLLVIPIALIGWFLLRLIAGGGDMT